MKFPFVNGNGISFSKLYLTAAVLLAVYLTGCSSYEKLVQEGGRNLTAGTYNEAAAKFQKAVDMAPGRSMAYLGLADYSANSPGHNYQAALEYLNKARVFETNAEQKCVIDNLRVSI